MRQAKEAAAVIDANPVPTLTIRWPEGAAQAAPSRRRIVLCAEEERDVLFRNQRICPRHVEIVSRQGEFFIVAMADDEPISVNGKPVLGEAHLREHDVIGWETARFVSAWPFPTSRMSTRPETPWSAEGRPSWAPA